MATPRLTKANMTSAQLAGYQVLCDAFHGEQHATEAIYPCGKGGIKAFVRDGELSTFDHDYLTRLVILAHDRCVRVQVFSSSAGRVGLTLHKRASREGSMFDRHPTMEEAIASVRPQPRAEGTALVNETSV